MLLAEPASSYVPAAPPLLDPALEPIADQVLAGGRLAAEQALQLYRSWDVHTLFWLAHHDRTRRHGRKSFYNINRHINYTNLCVLRCKFCAFYRPYSKTAPAPDAYELEPGQIVQTALDAYEAGATEIHMVGGLHPTLPFDWYIRLLADLRSACPRLHIKAFTAIEILHLCKMARPRLTIEQCLRELRAAGLDSLPGGGAEIFDDRVHDQAFKNKPGATGWFDVHRSAHELGICSNVTMLYGHIETDEQRIAHLLRIREHQDQSRSERSARFNACIPLSFIPDGSEFEREGLQGPTGLTDLRTLAIARLVLDNVDHIKAFWIMQSPKLAQVALASGCDDLDGTVQWYDITRREGVATDVNHQELPVEKLERLIVEAGLEPVERDSLYRRVVRGPGGPMDWTIQTQGD